MPAERLRDRYWDASGGFLWHMRALRYRHSLWLPFLASLKTWLEGWHPPTSRLLLVGPSAGWTLPRSLLMRFERVVALEPDPLARFLLKHRFGDAPLCFGHLDVFAPGGLDGLSRIYPGYAILFCNVLGQVAPESGAEQWCVDLTVALNELPWASWHDLASSARPPDRCGAISCSAGLSFEEALTSAWIGGEIVLCDHATHGLSAGGPFEAASWSLSPHQHHLVGWVTHVPRASDSFAARQELA